MYVYAYATLTIIDMKSAVKERKKIRKHTQAHVYIWVCRNTVYCITNIALTLISLLHFYLLVAHILTVNNICIIIFLLAALLPMRC